MSVSKPASRSRSGAAARATNAEPRAASTEDRIIDAAKVGVPVTVLGGTALVGWTFGPAPAVLVLAGGALIGVIAVFWASLRTLLGETPLSGADAYAIGAPRTEEEQKQAVLRAIKDLEFERSVGKISEEDYQELVAQYRAEAKRLLRILDADAQPRRAHVEALVARRLRRAGLSTETEADDADDKPEPPDEGADHDRSSAGEDRLDPQDRACASCGTINDEDAVFCKKCGARQVRSDDDDDDDDETRDEGTT